MQARAGVGFVWTALEPRLAQRIPRPDILLPSPLEGEGLGVRGHSHKTSIAHRPISRRNSRLCLGVRIGLTFPFEVQVHAPRQADTAEPWARCPEKA